MKTMFQRLLNSNNALIASLIIVMVAAAIAVFYVANVSVEKVALLAPPGSTQVGQSISGADDYFYRVTEGTMGATLPFPRDGNSNLSAHGFRFTCIPSHFSYDDPVVYPGEQGRAHLHMFFGNTAVTHLSTSESIINSGASTCEGGITNRSAYWIPTMLNEAGEAVLPDVLTNYYKSWVSDRDQIQPIPAGLQILANDQVLGSAGTYVAPPGENAHQGHIRVSDHDGLSLVVQFPDCIAVDASGDPVLTSPGGTSHVAYSTADGCPSSHPYLIPRLSQNIRWYNIPYESNWQFASDAGPETHGQTAHADYVAGWTEESAQIMADCVRDGWHKCGPNNADEMSDDMSLSPSGERLYQYARLLDTADATPLGVWPKNLTGHTGMDHGGVDPSDTDDGHSNHDDRSGQDTSGDTNDAGANNNQEVVDDTPTGDLNYINDTAGSDDLTGTAADDYFVMSGTGNRYAWDIVRGKEGTDYIEMPASIAVFNAVLRANGSHNFTTGTDIGVVTVHTDVEYLVFPEGTFTVADAIAIANDEMAVPETNVTNTNSNSNSNTNTDVDDNEDEAAAYVGTVTGDGESPQDDFFETYDTGSTVVGIRDTEIYDAIEGTVIGVLSTDTTATIVARPVAVDTLTWLQITLADGSTAYVHAVDVALEKSNEPVVTSSGGSSGSSRGGASTSGSGGSNAETGAVTKNEPMRTSLPAVDLFKRNVSFKQPAINNPEDVRNLQTFLNEFEGESLVVDGMYDAVDTEAMKRFQRKYRKEILDVWNLDDATGYVGITTRLKMNFLLKGQTAQCPAFTEYNGGITGITVSPEIGETQTILKELGMYNGAINNTWDSATNKALILFQETFREVMLDPWDITEGTGYKYKTTNKFLNYFAGCDTGAVELEGVGVYEGI